MSSEDENRYPSDVEETGVDDSDNGDDRGTGDRDGGERTDVDSELPSEEVVAEARRDAPDWDDEYIDRVADRLVFNYDLDEDVSAHGEPFTLYGRMTIESQKHFVHPSLSYANHGSAEHLFCRRSNRVTVADCERLVALGHDLADEWIDADEEHYSTDFTFVLVVPEIIEAVRAFVSGFRDRTLLKFGFYGHYEINLVVVAPADETIVASREAHVKEAFRLWESVETEDSGLFGSIVRRLWS